MPYYPYIGVDPGTDDRTVRVVMMPAETFNDELAAARLYGIEAFRAAAVRELERRLKRGTDSGMREPMRHALIDLIAALKAMEVK